MYAFELDVGNNGKNHKSHFKGSFNVNKSV